MAACSSETALYSAFGKSLCTSATVRRFGCQYRSCRYTPLNELEIAITAYISNISQADLQKVFANKIKRVQACVDARGHHLQHLS
jgi:peptide methionine sulfoxide reductase MsrA